MIKLFPFFFFHYTHHNGNTSFFFNEVIKNIDKDKDKDKLFYAAIARKQFYRLSIIFFVKYNISFCYILNLNYNFDILMIFKKNM